VLAVVPAEPPDKAESRPGDKLLAEVLVIAPGQPGALRLLVSVPDAEVQRVEKLPGRPQSSADERAEARRILERSGTLGEAVLEGGFVVDPPPGAPATGRYLEFHALDPDRTRILRELTVDLVAQKVWEGGSTDASR
jgi:hypothetical protein